MNTLEESGELLAVERSVQKYKTVLFLYFVFILLLVFLLVTAKTGNVDITRLKQINICFYMIYYYVPINL